MTSDHTALPGKSNICLLIAAAWACAAAVHADPLPPAIRACAGEADALKRLECYDRAVAAAAAVSPPAPLPGTAASPAARAPAAAPAAPVLPATALRQPVATAQSPAVPNPPLASAAAVPAPAAAPVPPPAQARHFTARVSKVEHYGDEVTVHLDNGQVWQQSEPTDRDLNLHAGDTVAVDRQMGSWWLSAGTLSMQVRLRQ